MGQKILVLGESGSGKSTATRNLDPASTFYINVIGKALPFKGWKSKYQAIIDGKVGNYISTYKFDDIVGIIDKISKDRPEVKTIVVDDAQYIMSYEFMERATERGFDKFSEIAQHMFNVLRAPDGTREDLTTIFLCHSEDVSANGFTRTKMKTIGKMLDDKITIEGLFTVVLLAYCHRVENKDPEYLFITQSNGTNTVKSPMGMFDDVKVPNDLGYVLGKVKEYEEG